MAVLAGSYQNRFAVTLSVALYMLIVQGSLTMAFVSTAITPTAGAGNLGTTITPTGNLNNITGGTRAGSNLFHSFGQFSVGAGDIANFQNVQVNGVFPATSNILGRITGGSVSNIFGTIQTTNFPGANLFLMNPAGFLFGPNAALNVQGMATFTTADYLRLTDGKLFYAMPNETADGLLSAAPVAAFGFLGSNPGAITVQGSQLSVQNGQGIELIGGNVTMQNGTLPDGTVQAAQLLAPAGHIHLASVASPGEVMAGTLDYAPNVNGQSFGQLGTINISQKSAIDASGGGGGTVLIRGGRFVLDDSTISANVTGAGVGPGTGIDIQVSQDAVIRNGAVLETNVSGSADPAVTYGGVHVKADRIEIIGSSDPDVLFTGIRSDVAAGSTGGNSGDIKLEANSILVQDAGPFTTILETQGGAGNAGNIIVNANGNVDINGGTVQSISQNGAGNAGNITLTSTQGNISLTNAALIQSNSDSGSGNAGNIALIAEGSISVIDGSLMQSQSQSASGNAGNIGLTSTHGNIIMTNGPEVSSQTMNSSGNAGNIIVSASDGDILLTGGDFPAFILTAIRGAGGSGGSGRIEITANNLTLLNSTISGDNISPMTPGNITVNLSGSLNLSGTSSPTFIQTTSRGSAHSADLSIKAHDIFLTDGSFVSTETFRSGAGGHLNISSENLDLTNGGQIRSGTPIADLNRGQQLVVPTGAGGTITIQGLAGPASSIVIDGANSGIFTNAEGTGAGGNTNISTQSLTVQNGGTISASTSGTAISAVGGNIAITAGQFVTLNNGASITANSTGLANAGDIVIHSGQKFTSTNSSVSTSATQATGGNITVTASDLVQLTNSQINASVQGSQTTIGGNIVIDPNFVILQNSQILAQATQGQGGNISITTNSLLSDANSLISASSQSGVNGTVNVQSPISQAGGKIIPLSKSTLETVPLLSQRCAALTGGQYSSFLVAGRETLPTEPGGWLATPLMALSVEEDLPSFRERMARSSMMHAEDGSLVSLRRLPTFGARTALFSSDGPEGCGS
jgi:filamentous haemagglutinin family N-terminal domain